MSARELWERHGWWATLVASVLGVLGFMMSSVNFYRGNLYEKRSLALRIFEKFDKDVPGERAPHAIIRGVLFNVGTNDEMLLEAWAVYRYNGGQSKVSMRVDLEIGGERLRSVLVKPRDIKPVSFDIRALPPGDEARLIKATDVRLDITTMDSSGSRYEAQIPLITWGINDGLHFDAAFETQLLNERVD
jgi:hypothetical protein